MQQPSELQTAVFMVTILLIFARRVETDWQKSEIL